ncbi:YjcG family protein [Bacillus tianshenii]|nr:YjcG family protein [Bacillus tianshenii]
MKYGIVIFPAKKLQDTANSYRKRYDPHYSLIPPHLTVKEPFEAEDDEIKKLAKELRTISKKVNPFSFQVYKVKSFHPTTNTIYLAVRADEELSKLHEMTHSGSFKTEKTFTFVPHITIGQKLSDQEHSDVLGRFEMMDMNHEETIDRFHLLYQLDNGSWTVYETFHLGEDL